MLVVLRFTSPGERVSDGEFTDERFTAEAAEALTALAACRGYVRGQVARAYDDPTAWCLVIEWASVGAYRRALSSYDVKLRATALLGRAVPEPSAFEPLVTAEPGGPATVAVSDRALPATLAEPANEALPATLAEPANEALPATVAEPVDDALEESRG